MLRTFFLAVLIGICQMMPSADCASAREWTEAELAERKPSVSPLELPSYKEKMLRHHAARVYALANAKTLVELSRLVGVVPERCQSTSDTSIVCSWQINKRMPGYSVLATLVGTTNLVFMICELPVNNLERAPGSCTLSVTE
jgi:hypothetical protein